LLKFIKLSGVLLDCNAVAATDRSLQVCNPRL
jgi:hypothetical protein